MPEYSSTKLTPSSTTKFPANNGNTSGYVEGADLTTKAEFNDAITSLTTIEDLSTTGWGVGSYLKKQGNHVYGWVVKAVNGLISGGRNYELGCTFPFSVSKKNIFVGTAYINNTYAPASYELDGNSDLICIVGSPYNGQTVTGIYIFVDAYL